MRKFNHMKALEVAFNIVYVASFIALMLFITGNATESYKVDSYSGETQCQNCDEMD